jgi:hypothetical protein
VKFVFNEEQAQALVNYLGQRPYVEVVNLIQMILDAGEEEPSQNGTEERKVAQVSES